jgi:hypothetical protein
MPKDPKNTPKPPKQHEWLVYQALNQQRKKPLLYPVEIAMKAENVGGAPHYVFEKKRMKKSKVVELTSQMLSNVPSAKAALLKDVIEHYTAYFKKDGDEITPQSPLDFNGVEHEVIYVIYLTNQNWAYSGYKQFVCCNDDQYNPLVMQWGTFDCNKGVIVQRAALDCEEDVLKYDLHVTIYQDGHKETPIIIDPRDDEHGGSGD